MLLVVSGTQSTILVLETSSHHPYRRWIINERGYANIVPSEGDKVYGLLFTITAADEKALDVYEGVPISYEKKIISVQHFGAGGDSGQKGGEYEIVDALVYVDFQRVTEDKPRKEYIDRMNMGIGDALKEGVPKEYVERYMRPFIPIVSVRVPDQDNDGPGGEVDE